MGSDAEELVFAKGFNLRFAGGDQRKRITQGIEYLQLVARLLTRESFVVFHHGGNVSPSKILLREIFAESDADIEREFHDGSGYNVMKRVSPVDFKLAQIENTRKLRPLGQDKTPRIAYFTP